MADKKVIYHVDDEPEMHMLVKMILGKHGFALEGALSGLEAIEQLATFRPDLILLDIAMPGMDGWALRQKLLEFPHLADVPVVVVTAKLGTADALQGLHEIETDAYLTKPFNPNVLLDTVRRIIGEGEKK